MKRFRAVVEGAGRRHEQIVANEEDWRGVVVKVRLFLRMAIAAQPGACVGASVTMHPVDSCDSHTGGGS